MPPIVMIYFIHNRAPWHHDFKLFCSLSRERTRDAAMLAYLERRQKGFETLLGSDWDMHSLTKDYMNEFDVKVDDFMTRSIAESAGQAASLTCVSRLQIALPPLPLIFPEPTTTWSAVCGPAMPAPPCMHQLQRLAGFRGGQLRKTFTRRMQLNESQPSMSKQSR